MLLMAILGHDGLPAVVSALIGGLICVVPSAVYARLAYARRHVPPAELLKGHYKAEAVKFGLTIIMFGATLVFFKDLSVVGLFCGYGAAISGYWFGLLIKN